MKTLLLAFACGLALAAAGVPARAADQNAQEQFEQRVRQINQQTQAPAAENVALQTIATETGVPLENVRAQRKRHPDFGTAGLMCANVLAAETKKNPEEFIKARQADKRWEAIARDNNVPLAKLNVRLDRLQKAVAPEAKKQRQQKS